MPIKPPLVYLLPLALILAACSSQQPSAAPGLRPPAARLNIFAAASLTGAFSELGDQFEDQYPTVEVVLNFAGSQQLAQQLASGAPADVFASANQQQMDLSIENGRVAAAGVQFFASNQLVVIHPRDNPGGLAQLEDLAKAGVQLVLAAREVPVGRYTLEFLDKAAAAPSLGTSFKEKTLANVVSYEQDVKFVLAKVALGEADAGIVYTSDLAGENASKVGQIEIPQALNVTAAYPIAVVDDSPNPALAQAFVDFVLSPAGLAVLAQYGFLPPVK